MNDFPHRLPLAQHRTDRDYARRSQPDLFETLWGDPNTRILPLWRGNALVRKSDGGGPELDLLPPHRVSPENDRVYLGFTTESRADAPAGTAVVSVWISDEEAIAIEPENSHWVSLREVAEHLSELDAGLFTEALAMHNWHRAHPRSRTTGLPSVADAAGWVRRDPESGELEFPRTDAAIIAAVVHRDPAHPDRDRILLGANRNWQPKRFSLLAGFVEPGESFETAVAREVYEESLARVVNVRYLGSQPWPFPASIMVGFTADLDPEQDPDSVQPDNDEIIDLAWFTREEVAARSDILPGRSSIARAIIEHWYGGPIDG